MDQMTIGMEKELWSIEQYRPGFSREWDRFVEESRNGTFLLTRPYMDYHAERFADCSLIARKGTRVRALLPANLSEDGILHSHQGLTYGGWILPQAHFDGGDMLDLFGVWRKWCLEVGITEVDYKPIPWIYHSLPGQEDLYALFRYGAIMNEVNLSSTVTLTNRRPFNSQQRRNLRDARRAGGIVAETEDIEEFHALLASCLAERHDTTPVHTAAELRLLHERFPDKIRFFAAYLGDRMAGGVCVYDCGQCVHAQYIASTPEGRSNGVLALIFDYLLAEVYADRRYFDFGISNEEHGRYLNYGLISQKSGLGGTGVIYSRYHLRFRE